MKRKITRLSAVLLPVLLLFSLAVPAFAADSGTYIFYLASNGSGENPDPGPVDPDPGPVEPEPDPDDSGVWGKLTELIGIVLDGIVGIIESVFQKLFDALKAMVHLLTDGLSSLVGSVVSFFTDIPAMSTGFLDFLTVAFDFIPPELVKLFVFSLMAAVIVGVIKAVRR